MISVDIIKISSLLLQFVIITFFESSVYDTNIFFPRYFKTLDFVHDTIAVYGAVSSILI